MLLVQHDGQVNYVSATDCNKLIAPCILSPFWHRVMEKECTCAYIMDQAWTMSLTGNVFTSKASECISACSSKCAHLA